MENYIKKIEPDSAENDGNRIVEAELTLIEKLFSEDVIKLDENVINMNVKPGSKVANLMNFALKHFEVIEIISSIQNFPGKSMNEVYFCCFILSLIQFYQETRTETDNMEWPRRIS
jgi:hypothetical protein